MVLLDHEHPRRFRVLHRFTVELLGLLELNSQIQQAERWNYSQAQGYSPYRAQVALGEYQNQYHRDKASRDESQIDLDIGEHDEPSIPVSGFELASTLGAGDTTSWVLPTGFLSAGALHCVGRGFKPYSYTDQESIRGKRLEETRDTPVIAIRASRQCSEENQDQGRRHQSPFSRIVIAHPSKKQLSNDGANKGDRSDILLSGRGGVLLLV